MPMTPTEAADALRDIEQTGRRSGQAFGYRYSGPYFILWGLVWIVGYAGTDLARDKANYLWLALIVAGAIGSAIVGRASSRRSAKAGWQSAGLVLIIFLFIAATYAVMGPVKPKAAAAFVPLIAAAAYSAVGLWAGLRWVIAGAAIAALTLGGFFLIHEHFNLWMAAVGGGGLVLAGLWMRSA